MVGRRILDVDVVLDIGVGIQPQSFTKPAIYIGIEPYLPYVERLREKTMGDPRYVLLNCSWEEGLRALAPDSVDAVYAFDIIEHLEKEEGLRLIKEAERVARYQVVIFTPWGFFPQSYDHPEAVDRWGMLGTFWQTHRSGWYPDDFGSEWSVVGCEDFHLKDHNEKPLAKPIGALWAFRNFNGTAGDKIKRWYPMKAPRPDDDLPWPKYLVHNHMPLPAYIFLSKIWHSFRKLRR